jgi:hypothetical protein
LTVKFALTDEPEIFAVTIAVFVAVTLLVAHVNAADVEPPEIVTDDGPPQTVDVDFNATTVPPLGAAELILTVPVEDDPPTMVLGLNEREVSFGA